MNIHSTVLKLFCTDRSREANMAGFYTYLFACLLCERDTKEGRKSEGRKGRGDKQSWKKERKKDIRPPSVPYTLILRLLSLALPNIPVNPNSYNDLTDRNIFSKAKYFIT
jgi:hypothetical protein